MEEKLFLLYKNKMLEVGSWNAKLGHVTGRLSGLSGKLGFVPKMYGKHRTWIGH